MRDNSQKGPLDYISLTGDIVSAYVANNSVSQEELKGLIGAVYEALARTSRPSEAAPETPVPPLPIKGTVRPDYIISLEDGRRYKSMRRHLAARGLTPEQVSREAGTSTGLPHGRGELLEDPLGACEGPGLGRARKGGRGKAAQKSAGKG